MGTNADARKKAVDSIKITCTECGNDVKISNEDSCPNCGLLELSCVACGWSAWWGE